MAGGPGRRGCGCLGLAVSVPLAVASLRGGAVESRHRVHAVAVRDGEVVEAAGDPGLVTFMRSAAKPLQALPLARAREAVPSKELAIACASHLALPEQLAAVEGLLVLAAASEDDLECGVAGDPPSRLKHNCSGKHAGMLFVCRERGWPHAGYRLPEHRLQRLLLAEVSTAAELAEEEIATGTDGCGVVSFAMPLRRMGHAFARLPELDGGAGIVAAMRAHPHLIRGPGAPDTVLMQTLPGWVAKGGAEGLLCAAGPKGLGVALKVEDGAARAVRPALAGFLHRLGYDLPQLEVVSVENSRGDRVGEIRLAP
jgi:L-asparaginase II